MKIEKVCPPLPPFTFQPPSKTTTHFGLYHFTRCLTSCHIDRWYLRRFIRFVDNWLASVSIEIPWEQGEMNNMLASVFKPRRRHLAERMFKIVRRKNAAITSSGVAEKHLLWLTAFSCQW